MSSTNPLCETKRWSRFHLSLSVFAWCVCVCVCFQHDVKVSVLGTATASYCERLWDDVTAALVWALSGGCVLVTSLGATMAAEGWWVFAASIIACVSWFVRLTSALETPGFPTLPPPPAGTLTPLPFVCTPPPPPSPPPMLTSPCPPSSSSVTSLIITALAPLLCLLTWTADSTTAEDLAERPPPVITSSPQAPAAKSSVLFWADEPSSSSSWPTGARRGDMFWFLSALLPLRFRFRVFPAFSASASASSPDLALFSFCSIPTQGRTWQADDFFSSSPGRSAPLENKWKKEKWKQDTRRRLIWTSTKNCTCGTRKMRAGCVCVGDGEGGGRKE